MKLADEMSQLKKQYYQQFFDGDLYNTIISLIRQKASKGGHYIEISVNGPAEMYYALIDQLCEDGFIAHFSYGAYYSDGSKAKDKICISWR